MRPEGVLLEASRRAASHYGLDEAFFLVGGSTQGLTTALLAALSPGDTLVLHRGAHRSVLAALVHSGADPRFVPDRWDPLFGVSWPDVDAMAQAVLSIRPRAALVTYPTYTGLAPDLQPLRAACDKARTLLVIDSAHGAHFGLGPTPPLASAFRPDLVVFGMHKSGGALTPGSLLGRIGDRLDPDRLDAVRCLVGTSSPSYPIMASIDLAVSNLKEQGERLTEETTRTLQGLDGEALFTPPAGLPADPTRKVLGSRHGGALIGKVLRERGVEPEYVSPSHTLLYAPLGLTGLPRGILQALATVAGPLTPHPPLPIAPRRALARDAFLGPARSLPLEEAAGFVSADLLGVTPPGIPSLWPGEEIPTDLVHHLQEARREGLTVMGLTPRGEVRVVDPLQGTNEAPT